MKKTINIEGMHCEHCKKRVENALSKIDGITGAEVSLENSCAVVECSSDVKNDLFIEAIGDLGFDVMNIQNQ